jgi:uncharacterized protein (TIGR03067 family)
MNPVLLALAVSLSAPAAKEAPKKDPPALLGEWVGEKAEAAGMPLPVPPGGITMEFTADGRLVTREGTKPPEESAYTHDPKKAPAEIDITPPRGAKDMTFIGIYKVEGDTLTLCLGIAGKRPAKFESQVGSDSMLMTFKRAPKKKE